MKTALITGASGGIGKELARCFAKDGFGLILVAQHMDELEKVAQEMKSEGAPEVSAIAADLSKPGAAQNIFDEVLKLHAPIDALVNNAGFGTYGQFWKIPLDRETDEITVNVTVLTQLCKLFLPAMIAQRNGRILNIASVAGFWPGPLMSVYYATKAYVLHFSIALNQELKGTGVSVTALCPGPTATNFAKTAKKEGSSMFQGTLIGPAPVARIGYNALMHRKPIAVVGTMNSILTALGSIAPKTFTARVAMWMQKSVKNP